MSASNHAGNPWQAELAVVALERGAKRLEQTHPKLFAELNLTADQLERLFKVVQSRGDAARLFGHPHADRGLRNRLERDFGPLEPK